MEAEEGEGGGGNAGERAVVLAKVGGERTGGGVAGGVGGAGEGGAAEGEAVWVGVEGVAEVEVGERGGGDGDGVCWDVGDDGAVDGG